MPREYLRAEVRREQVLQAAVREFAVQGFHATSVEDLCRAAGLSPGGLYRHFRSKREIVVALVAADAAATASRLEDAVAAATDPWSAVDALMVAWLSRLGERATAVLEAEIVAEAARAPEVAAAASEHDERLAALVRTTLSAAAATGSLAATDPDAAVELLAVVVDGIATRCAVHGRLEPAWIDLARGVAASLIGASPAASAGRDTSGHTSEPGSGHTSEPGSRHTGEDSGEGRRRGAVS